MTHGGKREGAGRKPSLSPEKRRKPHTVWLSEEEAESLRAMSNGNLSEGVREALHHAMKGLVEP